MLFKQCFYMVLDTLPSLFTLDSRHCCVLKLRGRDGNKMGGGRGKG